MKQATFFICEICEYADKDAEVTARHESFCRKRKEAEDKELARRQATGQLTISQLLLKCDALPNLPVVINCESFPKYHGKFPSYTDSYRGYYDELAINVDEQAKSAYQFRVDLSDSLHTTYSGYKGGEFRMYEDTFVWLAEYGDDTGVIITDLVVAPSGDVIHLTGRVLE